MNLYCLTSFYDEPRLADAIRDAIDCGATHVILLDGAYKHYPHLNPTSPPEQEQAVVRLCAARNVELVSTAAIGATEAEKRTMLFDLAYQHGATPQDWLFVQDGDQTITGKRDIKPLLRTARHDVYDTMVLEYDSKRFDDITRRRWVRQVFRAVPGLHVDPVCHWRYLDAQGRVIWGYNSIQSNGDLPIVLHNDSTGRGHQRNKGRDAYYDTRSSQDVERDDAPTRCYYCDAPPTQATNTDIHFAVAPDGLFGMSHRRTLFTCDKHKRRVEYENTCALNVQHAHLMQTRPDLAATWFEHMREREQQARKVAA
jgi:hypothetical protein